jgi:hypothetical protein
VLRKSRTLFWDLCVRVVEGEAATNENGCSLFLPCSLRNPWRRVFYSPTVSSGLQSCMPPVTEKQERGLVHALIDDLNANFGFKLDPCLSHERGAVMLDQNADKKRIFVLGGSHMNKTACFMLPYTINLAEPGFTASSAATERISQRLLGYGTGPWAISLSWTCCLTVPLSEQILSGEWWYLDMCQKSTATVQTILTITVPKIMNRKFWKG